MSKENKEIKQHGSDLRKLMCDSHGLPYISIKSLEEARSTENAYLIMQGDDGGQIYLVAPINLVKCSEKDLNKLLKELDDIAWKDITMANIYYEVYTPNSIISGGMGGGIADVKLWIHKEFENLKNKIEKVLSAENGD